jgi:hypothetical protein
MTVPPSTIHTLVECLFYALEHIPELVSILVCFLALGIFVVIKSRKKKTVE